MTSSPPERLAGVRWVERQGPRGADVSEPAARYGLLARNTVLNLVGLATPFLVGIVVIPVLVRALGVDRFGLLSLIWVVLGNLVVFDLGVGRGTTKFVAEALGRGDTAGVPTLVWTMATVQAVVGVVAALAFAAVTPALVERIFPLAPVLRAEAQTTFRVVALAIPFILVSTCFTSVLEATQRFDLLNAVVVPASAANVVVPLVAVLLGWGLPAVVAVLVVARAATLPVFFALSVRAFPPLAGARAPSPAAALRVAPFVGWLAVATVTAPVLRYLDRYILAALLSVSAVAYYSVAFDTIERLWIVPTAAVLTLFPALSAFSATGAAARSHAAFVLTVKALLIVVAPPALAVVAWAPVLLRAWLGSEFAEQSAAAFRILALAALVGVLAPVAGAALQAYGRPDVIAKLYLVYLPLNVAVVVALVGALGVTGAALSMLLRALLDTSIVLAVALRTMQLRLATFAAGVWRTVVVVGVAGILLWFTPRTIAGMPLQASVAVGVLAIFVLGIWRWALTAPERALAWRLLTWSGS